jgi:TetR/AcrR family transcriptional regulator, mexJK operon transcriptional repressor
MWRLGERKCSSARPHHSAGTRSRGRDGRPRRIRARRRTPRRRTVFALNGSVIVLRHGDTLHEGPDGTYDLHMTDTTEELSPERRASILVGASRVFAEDGYEGASMSHIAREAGVSKGTLYNYFDSKAELFTAYVAQECAQALPKVFDGAEPDGEPAEVLRGIGLRIMRMMLSPLGVSTYRVVVAEAGKFPELARAFYEAGPARAIKHLSGWLSEQASRGRLELDDPDFAAEQFFALCQTRLALLRRLRIVETADEAEITRIVDAAVTMFLAHYRAPVTGRSSAEAEAPA